MMDFEKVKPFINADMIAAAADYLRSMEDQNQTSETRVSPFLNERTNHYHEKLRIATTQTFPTKDDLFSGSVRIAREILKR